MDNNIILKKTEEFKKIINNQDLNQQIWLFIYVIYELYRLIMSTLLIIFVPQNCDGNLCTLNQKLVFNNTFYNSGIIVNFFTLFSYLVLYAFEITREHKLIFYLDVNNTLPLDNNSVANNLSKLDINKKNLIYFLDKCYQKIGLFCFFIFLANTIISAFIISKYVLGNQTISVFVTNVLFMVNKLYHIYVLIYTEKNIFYSAYLFQKVQFNDIDIYIKEELELDDTNHISCRNIDDNVIQENIKKNNSIINIDAMML